MSSIGIVDVSSGFLFRFFFFFSLFASVILIPTPIRIFILSLNHSLLYVHGFAPRLGRHVMATRINQGGKSRGNRMTRQVSGIA